MISYLEFKKLYLEYTILFAVLLFVLIYIIINWNKISAKEYFQGQYVRPLLITGILFLIIHLFMTWDDNDQNEEFILPKYKLSQNNNNNNETKNEIIAANTQINNPAPLPLQSNLESKSKNKYRIVNAFDMKENKNLLENIKNSNHNIFISQKNTQKYGLKF